MNYWFTPPIFRLSPYKSTPCAIPAWRESEACCGASREEVSSTISEQWTEHLATKSIILSKQPSYMLRSQMLALWYCDSNLKGRLFFLMLAFWGLSGIFSMQLKEESWKEIPQIQKFLFLVWFKLNHFSLDEAWNGKPTANLRIFDFR